MAIEDHSPDSAFKAATLGALRVGALVPAGAITGSLLVALFLHLFGSSEVQDGRSFFTLLYVSLVFGLKSVAGTVLVIAGIWMMMKTMQEEIERIDFFLFVAAGQVVCYISATITLQTFHQTWFIGPLSLMVLGGLWWGSKLWRRRSESADIERMQVEGEAFRREMRERKRKGAIRRFRN
jgi:hypothetical protein